MLQRQGVLWPGRDQPVGACARSPALSPTDVFASDQDSDSDDHVVLASVRAGVPQTSAGVDAVSDVRLPPPARWRTPEDNALASAGVGLAHSATANLINLDDVPARPWRTVNALAVTQQVFDIVARGRHAVRV